MNEPSPPDLTPDPKAPESKPDNINIGMAVIAVVLIIVNIYLAFKIGVAEEKFGGELPGLLLFSLGRAVVIPVIFVGVFSLSKNYRNNAARVKVIMWGSVFILVSNMGGLSKIASLPAGT